MNSGPHKRQALRDARALHPHPERVVDALFDSHPFFDRQDKVQVKYEMLRRRELEGAPLQQTCERFGFSRESYRKILARFKESGFAGLFERKRGRKKPLKAGDDVIEFIHSERARQPDLSWAELAERVRETHGVTLSRRTIFRALSATSIRGPKKKRR